MGKDCPDIVMGYLRLWRQRENKSHPFAFALSPSLSFSSALCRCLCFSHIFLCRLLQFGLATLRFLIVVDEANETKALC